MAEVGQSGVRIRPLGGSRAGEVRLGRFLRNPRVTPAEMIATARARTASLVQGRHVLVIQDTTSLRDDGTTASLRLHPSIAVDARNGVLLGLVHGVVLAPLAEDRPHRHKRPLADKESHRWLDAAVEAGKLAEAGAACVTVVADREGDVYESFACRPPTAELLIRARHDRILAGPARLFTCTDAVPELGRETVALPAGPGRPARTAVLALKACRVTIARPKRNHPAEAAKLPSEITLSLVEAREVDPPAGVPPVHWRLLTTHAVGSLAEAQLMIRFYRERWTIEQLFRIMKTKGFNIEALRMADSQPFTNLATATLIAAIQVLQLVRDREGRGERPLEDVFDRADQLALEEVCASLEGKTERQKNPHPKGSLAYAAWVCARLGGWTGYYGKPGPVVMFDGLLRFRAMLHGWKLGRLV